MKISFLFILSAIAYSSSLVVALPLQGNLTTREVLNPADNIDARELSEPIVDLAARELEFEDLEERSPQGVRQILQNSK